MSLCKYQINKPTEVCNTDISSTFEKECRQPVLCIYVVQLRNREKESQARHLCDDGSFRIKESKQSPLKTVSSLIDYRDHAKKSKHDRCQALPKRELINPEKVERTSRGCSNQQDGTRLWSWFLIVMLVLLQAKLQPGCQRTSRFRKMEWMDKKIRILGFHPLRTDPETLASQTKN